MPAEAGRGSLSPRFPVPAQQFLDCHLLPVVRADVTATGVLLVGSIDPARGGVMRGRSVLGIGRSGSARTARGCRPLLPRVARLCTVRVVVGAAFLPGVTTRFGRAVRLSALLFLTLPVRTLLGTALFDCGTLPFGRVLLLGTTPVLRLATQLCLTCLLGVAALFGPAFFGLAAVLGPLTLFGLAGLGLAAQLCLVLLVSPASFFGRAAMFFLAPLLGRTTLLRLPGSVVLAVLRSPVGGVCRSLVGGDARDRRGPAGAGA